MPSPSDEHEAEDGHEAEDEQPDDRWSDKGVANEVGPGLNAGVSVDAPKRHGVAPRWDPTPRSQVRVSTQDGAAELCIIDRTYALVATGVGKLDVSLPAGEYQLRQRVGDDEQIQPLTVLPGGLEQEVELPPLAFPSPIPLPGTTLADPLGTQAKRVEKASGNFRLLLWAPDLTSALGDRKHARDRVEAQLKRLRLEGFLTGASQEFVLVAPDENDLANSVSSLIAMNLSPGPYVLIQQGSAGRQRCMPVWICPGFVTALYLLVLQVDGEDVPVELDHAAVAFLSAGDFERNYVSSLLQLESARKALSMGRPAHGSTWQLAGLSETISVKNPLLYLLDAQLLAGQATAPELDAVQSYVSMAAGLLGNDFPDVAALRTLAQPAQPKIPPMQLNLRGPPLLRRSWAQLLATPQGNAALGGLMDFAFQVDGTGTWLLWSEDKDSRQKRARYMADRQQPVPSGDAPFLLSRAGRVVSLMGILVKGLSYSTGRMSGGLERSDQDIQRIQLKQVSVDKVVQMLVLLSDSGLLQRLLDKGQQLAAEQGAWVNQDSMRQLLASLQVLLDKTLVKAMTAETLVRQSLGSLGLPDEKVVGLARSLMALLLEKVSNRDRTLAVKTLEGVLTVADAWLKVQNTVPALISEADGVPLKGKK
jgi:hypothetical protein